MPVPVTKRIADAAAGLVMALAATLLSTSGQARLEEPPGLRAQQLHGLIVAIQTWLEAQFSVPMPDVIPNVRFVSEPEIGRLHGSEFAPHAWSMVAKSDDEERAIISVYVETTETIFLPIEWKGDSAAEISILVHEVVHHVQFHSGSSFACAAERERFAYEAQEIFLGYFATGLEQEFGLDGMTLLLLTSCYQF